MCQVFIPPLLWWLLTRPCLWLLLRLLGLQKTSHTRCAWLLMLDLSFVDVLLYNHTLEGVITCADSLPSSILPLIIITLQISPDLNDQTLKTSCSGRTKHPSNSNLHSASQVPGNHWIHGECPPWVISCPHRHWSRICHIVVNHQESFNPSRSTARCRLRQISPDKPVQRDSCGQDLFHPQANLLYC